MSALLSRIKRGQIELPPRVMLSGPQGIGKTTWASKSPSPLFIAAEDGLTGMGHVERFAPASAAELTEFLNELLQAPTAFQNIVFDTADWLERMIHEHICKRDNYKDIEAYGGGWGKGDKISGYELVALLQKLEQIREKHKVGIIFLSHVQIKTFTPPGGDAYDRYQPKGGKQFTGVLAEWVDASLFAVHEVFKSEADKKAPKIIAGERIIKTSWSPAWDAKNRYNLPEELPLEWDAFEQAVAANSPAALREQVKKLHATAKLENGKKETWAKWLTKIETCPADKLKQAIENLSKLQ